MSRSEPLVDWIEIQVTIVAVMNVDANTNRISLEARLPQAGDRPPGDRVSRGCVGEVVSVLTPVPAPHALSTSPPGWLERREKLWIREVACSPRGRQSLRGEPAR